VTHTHTHTCCSCVVLWCVVSCLPGWLVAHFTSPTHPPTYHTNPPSQLHYPSLLKDVRIRLIELMDHVLSTYDRKIGEYTAQRFGRAGEAPSHS
jgi:hypothetical protein